MAKRAVVLTSGGLDSTTCLALAREAGFEIYALSFDYGQRHKWELAAAAAAARAFGAKEHPTIAIDLRAFGQSALTSEIPVPKDNDIDKIGGAIPVTYVPARNTIFLAYAIGWAEVLGAADIFIGVNAMDYSGYPDCRPEYIAAFEAMANLATAAGTEGGAKLTIHAPLIALTKKEIILKGTALGVDYSQTHTCYDPNERGEACGHCEACVLRRRGFEQAGIDDPTIYSAKEM